MRRGSRKMWCIVPCKSKKSLQYVEPRMEIEEILKEKLATIIEEPETCEENGKVLAKYRSFAKKGKKICLKAKMGHMFRTQFSVKDSYVLLMTSFASRHGLAGLSQC
ncbi:hypothetical protein DCAR_0623851 [Daucus carota subsp. sativus]|uniref:Uncharacterized protein n=1 Tax=Daucus carota subsp. sativus TaxID=79200 RepID=A0AAF0XCF3_DAUCS|nr:hypothetical protein DCAR_0623851 [Daucus carota subsp. sativus]